MRIQVEVSLYPLGAGAVLPAILELIADLERAGLTVEPGPLSTLVSGECEHVFAVLGAAYARSAGEGRRVLVLKAIGEPPARPAVA